MSLVVKAVFFLLFVFLGSAYAKDLHMLVVGPSVSANCNEHMHGLTQGVYQIGLDGLEKPAIDPLDWADCRRGSVWIPLGKILIDAKFADKVAFMPVSVADVTDGHWLEHGEAFEKLNLAMKVAKEKHIEFDYVFLQQEFYGDESGSSYRLQLIKLIKNIRSGFKVGKILISQHANCFGQISPNVLKAQHKVSRNALYGLFPGPDTNLLDSDFRFDSCNLNKRGQEKLAQQWFSAIQAAENDPYKETVEVQKETLLYYFK